MPMESARTGKKYGFPVELTLSAAILLALTGCGHAPLVTSQCEVPPMYLQVYGGLIDPTWEPEGEMRSQIDGLSADDQVCWYGHTDGTVEARVNPTAGTWDFHLFRKINDKWTLVDSGQAITIN